MRRRTAALRLQCWHLNAAARLPLCCADEADALAALAAAAKELQVMPTIHAAGSSEVDVASGEPAGLGPHGMAC